MSTSTDRPALHPVAEAAVLDAALRAMNERPALLAERDRLRALCADVAAALPSLVSEETWNADPRAAAIWRRLRNA
jgi:hypothetical protein